MLQQATSEVRHEFRCESTMELTHESATAEVMMSHEELLLIFR